VLASRGTEEVRAELPDGRRCYLPLAWTDRRPRPAPCKVEGRLVRLALPGLLQLASWIAARSDGKKVDKPDPASEKDAHGVDPGGAATAPVVGKAGASRTSRTTRPGQRRKRGSR
jgi:hypothetical protein